MMFCECRGCVKTPIHSPPQCTEIFFIDLRFPTLFLSSIISLPIPSQCTLHPLLNKNSIVMTEVETQSTALPLPPTSLSKTHVSMFHCFVTVGVPLCPTPHSVQLSGFTDVLPSSELWPQFRNSLQHQHRRSWQPTITREDFSTEILPIDSR